MILFCLPIDWVLSMIFSAIIPVKNSSHLLLNSWASGTIATFTISQGL